MAGLQKRGGSFRIIFRFEGKQRSVTLGRVGRSEAEAKVGAVDLLLLRIRQRLIEVPAGVSIEEFVLTDGKARPPGPALRGSRRRNRSASRLSRSVPGSPLWRVDGAK